MIVRLGFAVLIGVTAKDRVRMRIPLRLDLPSAIDECMWMRCREDRVEHNGIVAGCRVLHADRGCDRAGGQSVLLIFYGSCTYGNISQKIIEIRVVLRIKHLIGAGKTCLGDRSHVKVSCCQDTFEKVRSLIRIRLVEHALIAFTRRSRLIRVDTRNDDDLVLYLFLQRTKAGDIVDNGIFIIRGAWSDDEHEFIRETFNDSLYFSLCIDDCLFHLGRNGIDLLDLLRKRQFFHIFRVHSVSPSTVICRFFHPAYMYRSL